LKSFVSPGHTKVSLSLIVSDVLAVSEKDFTVSIFAYMITSWTESRIYYRGVR
jgi:hypothetical protein